MSGKGDKMNEYFVKVFKEEEGVKSKELLHFYGDEALFDWMQDNKDTLFSVYAGKCVLDYS